VQGSVVKCEHFGVFADIGVGFPALLLIVRFADGKERPRQYPDDYPAVGSPIEGRVYAFSDSDRQIAITQRPREEWMNGEW
jgi:hypothetical protein